MRKVLLTILLSFSLLPASFAEVCFVQKVIDGTTFQTINGETVKLIGVNLDKNQNDKDAKDISDFVRGFISGNLIELEFDAQERDSQGNLLAYVWFEYPEELNIETMKLPASYEVTYVEDSLGVGHFLVFLNASMIKSGFASPNTQEPNVKHAKLFEDIYNERQSKNKETIANANVHVSMLSSE